MYLNYMSMQLFLSFFQMQDMNENATCNKYTWITLNYLSARVQCFKSFERDSFLRSSLIEYLGLLLKMRILVVVPPLVALPMVVPPSSFFCESWHFVWTFCSSHCCIPTKDQQTTHTRRNIQIIQSKDSVVIELKVIFYATEKVGF